MKTTLRLILILFIGLLMFCLVGIIKTGVHGYEISIYTTTPLFTWLILCGILGTGICILIIYTLSDKRSASWFWLGLVMIVSANLLVIYLPSLRGYFYEGNADPIAQVGFVIDILKNEHLSELDIYPITHTLMAMIAKLLDLHALEVAKLLTGLIYMYYVTSMILLASVVAERKGKMVLGVIASTPLICRVFLTEIYPHSIANMTLPLFLYIYFKRLNRNNGVWVVPFIIFILGYSFFHPVVATTLLTSMFVLELSRAFLPNLWREKVEEKGIEKVSIFNRAREIPLYACFTIMIVSYDWLIRFPATEQKIRMIDTTLFTQPQVGRVVQGINLSQEEFILYILKAWSDNLIYLCLFAVALISFLKVLWRKKSMESLLFKLIILLLAGDIYGVLFFFVVQAQLPSRALELSLFTVIGPVICGIALYTLLEIRGHKKINQVLTFIVIFFVSMVCISSMYASPYTYMQNRQVTKADIAGLRWLLNYKPSDRLYTTLGVVHAYVYLVQGFDSPNLNNDTRESMLTLYYLRDALPPHLGYEVEDNHTSLSQKRLGDYYLELGEIFAAAHALTETEKRRYNALAQFYMNDVYLIVTYRFIAPHLDPVLQSSSISAPEDTRWDITLKDLERLKADVTVNRIFSNSHLWVNLVHTSR